MKGDRLSSSSAAQVISVLVARWRTFEERCLRFLRTGLFWRVLQWRAVEFVRCGENTDENIEVRMLSREVWCIEKGSPLRVSSSTMTPVLSLTARIVEIVEMEKWS